MDYLHPDAQLLPSKKNAAAAAAQSNCFMKLAKSIQAIAQMIVFPKFASQQALSLQHMGFIGHLAGPGLPNAQDTDIVKAARQTTSAQGSVTQPNLSEFPSYGAADSNCFCTRTSSGRTC